jgi:hypothetical protein
VEYTIRSPKGQAGLRLFKQSPNSPEWMLEVVLFGDYSTEMGAVARETEQVKIPHWFLEQLSQENREQIKEHNEKVSVAAINDETYEPYRPEAKVFTLHHMGDRLYGKVLALINGFRGEGIPLGIAGGDSVTFRCVVGDEVWTLRIHVPQKRALQMSNLCRQIIEDAMTGNEFDEWKYIRMLEPIEF